MKEYYENSAKSLLDSIAKTVGFSNDLSLFEGKTGIAILLFYGSRYFSSKELSKISGFLLDDITDDKDSVYLLCQNRSCEIIWAINHLYECGFIKIQENFFRDIDEILFRKIENYSTLDIVSYIFLGNYILSRNKTSKKSKYWRLKANQYIDNVLNIINIDRTYFIYHFNHLESFWYAIYQWDKMKFVDGMHSKWFRDVVVFYKHNINELSHTSSSDPCFQFFNRFTKTKLNKIRFENNTISCLNEIYLNRLLFSDYMMPSINETEHLIKNLLKKTFILKDLESLLSYQNIGIKGYLSGFTWALLNFLHDKYPKNSM